MNTDVRCFPSKDTFLGNKQLNDIIYGYFQTNSHVMKDGTRFCLKSDVTASKIVKYFNELNQSIASEPTIRKVIQLFIKENLILNESVLDGKKVYIIPDAEKGEFVLIKTSTLKYLVDTANTNVIKVYAFLKLKQYQHDYYGYQTPYMFSQKKLLEILGYGKGANNKTANLDMIRNILISLQNNGLIQIHQEWVNTGNDNATQYYVLDAVNEDYRGSTAKDKSVIDVPVIDTDAALPAFRF